MRVGSLRVLAAVLAALLVVGGCSRQEGSTDTSTTTAPVGSVVSLRDAERLARMLYENYRAGGARIELSTVYSTVATVTMTGTIDWRHHEGDMVVLTTYSDGRPQDRRRIVFTEETVDTELTPGSDTNDSGGAKWLRRSPDQRQPLDQLIQLVMSLASTRPENPRLIQQSGATVRGSRQIDGRPAEGYSLADAQGVFWLSLDEGRLVQFVGNLPGFAGETIVDVRDHGPVTVSVPVESQTMSGASPRSE